MHDLSAHSALKIYVIDLAVVHVMKHSLVHKVHLLPVKTSQPTRSSKTKTIRTLDFLK